MASSTGVRRVMPALAGAIAFAFLGWLYLDGQTGLNRHIIRAWGIKVWSFPFLDTDTVLSAVRCLNKGVDVYVTNPCDVLKRQYDYSPLWMVLTVFPMTPAWLPPVGLVVDIAFLLSLLMLPVGRGAGATLLIGFGVLSSGTMFAVERGNNDLVLFALVAGAAMLTLRRPALRLVGYALLLLAGLLKYYPLATMLVVCRERLPRFLAVTAVSIIVTLVFAAISWHDLTRALAIIPTGSYSEDMFGSIIVGGRTGEAFRYPELKTPIRLAMIVVSFIVAFLLSRRAFIPEALDRLTDHEQMFLFTGSLMVAGCFFTAQNIGYRVVHLLLVLPPLLALGQFRRIFLLAAMCCLALLWSIWWRGIMPTPPISYITWTLREMMWWFLVTLLDACIIVLTGRSATVVRLLDVFKTARPAHPVRT